MYNNIGGKIKGLAKGTFIVEALGAIITGIALICCHEEIPGVITLLAGPIVAWISSWLLYGFGEIIDKLCDIECNTRGSDRKPEKQSKADSERIAKIEKLRSKGLITEEEYLQAISKKK